VRSSTCSEGSENGSAPEAAALVRERADRGPLVLGLASGRVSARCPENLARRAFPGKRRHAPDRDFQGTKDGRRSRCALVLGASRLRLMRSLRSHLFPGRFAPKASPKMRSLRSREPGTFVALRGASWRFVASIDEGAGGVREMENEGFSVLGLASGAKRPSLCPSPNFPGCIQLC
jgi:hypothetical protein